MRFARIVFTGAGVLGILVLTPLFFLRDLSGRVYAPPADYPHFFFGFFAVAMVWQFAFLLIGSNPARYRPLMPIAVLEKAGFVAIVSVLHGQGRIADADALAAAPDAVLGLLFIAAFLATRPAPPART